MPIIIDLMTTGKKAPGIAKGFLSTLAKTLSRENWKYDEEAKTLTIENLTANEHGAIIADIYKVFDTKKKDYNSITIDPPRRDFKTPAETAAEEEMDQINELPKKFPLIVNEKEEKVEKFPFRVFLRTDGLESVINHPLPARCKTPAEHMMIFDNDSNNYVDSGYLSVFEGYTGHNNNLAFKETKKITRPGGYFHVLFIPDGINKINLNDEDRSTQSDHNAYNGPLLFGTGNVKKLFIETIDKDGTVVVVEDNSGRRSITIPEYLLSGSWPEGMMEISFPVNQLNKKEKIFVEPNTPADQVKNIGERIFMESNTPVELFVRLDNAIRRGDIEPSCHKVEFSHDAVLKKGQAGPLYKEGAAKEKDSFVAELVNFINTNELACEFTGASIIIKNLSEANEKKFNTIPTNEDIKCERHPNDDYLIMLSPDILSELKQSLVPVKASPSADKGGPSEFYQSLLAAALTQWGTGEQAVEAAQAASLLEKGGKKSKEDLALQAQNYGFECIDVGRDGNCFFHAVAAQLNLRNGAEYTDGRLRDIAIDHIITNRNLYEDAIPEDFANFIAQNMEQGEWADNIMIQALSRELNIDIVVIRNDGTPPNIIIRSMPEATVYLGYEVGRHYQSLAGWPTNQTLSALFRGAEIDQKPFQPINHPAQPAVDPSAEFQQLAVEKVRSELIRRRQTAILFKSIAQLKQHSQMQTLTQFVQAFPTLEVNDNELMVEAGKLNKACEEFLASLKDLRGIYKKLPLNEPEFAKIGELIKSREGELTALADKITIFCKHNGIDLKAAQPKQSSHSIRDKESGEPPNKRPRAGRH